MVPVVVRETEHLPESLAVFSVTHAVVLAPLPYAQPDRIVRIYQQEPGKPDTRRAVSAPQFRMLRREAASFVDVGARFIREDLGLDLSTGGGGQRLRTLMVTSDYFRTLCPERFRGPGFEIEDEKVARAATIEPARAASC